MEGLSVEYSGPPGEEVFGWTHQPVTATQKDMGVVLCYPLGHEYTHLHRWYRHWAHHLSASGFVTVRFDYRGTGNSSGNALDEARLESWLADIEAQGQKLRSEGCNSIALGGVRFGATLACLAAGRFPVEQLILINPCFKGRTYARELRALHALSGNVSSSSRVLHCAGHPMSRSTLQDIADIDLFQQPGLTDIPTLLIQPDEGPGEPGEPGKPRIPDWARSADRLNVKAYQKMVDAPHNNQIPTTTLADICQWMNERAKGRAGSKADPGNAQRQLTRSSMIPDWHEQAMWVGTKPALFGILSAPAIRHDTTHIALLLNAGSAHHAGPNRLYQELAQQLAGRGIASLRFDLENLGDSAIIGCTDENHPYPACAGPNIEQMVGWLRKNFPQSKVSLVGLCAGAHATFHCALNNLKADNYVMINPLAFYWDPSMSLDIPDQLDADMEAAYLSAAMGSSSKWFKLIRGEVNLSHLLKFVVQFGFQRARDALGRLRQLSGNANSQLTTDLSRLLDEGRKLHFVFSHRDPGQKLLSRGAGPLIRSRRFKSLVSMNTIAPADHTFTNADSRRDLAQTLAKILLP